MRTNRMLAAVVLVCSCVAASGLARLSAAADEPLKEAGLQALLELKIDDEVIIARIKKSGLAFAGDEAVLKRLAEAGASPEVLGAVREAGEKKPAAGGVAAITYADVLKLLQLEIPEDQILKRLAKSPTVFTLSTGQIDELKGAGATEKLLTAMQTARNVSAQTAELITNFAIVLDCSGSMKEKTTESETKMEAAKRVVADLIQKIPEGLNVTFVIYGHEVFGGADDPRNCEAVKVARPLSPLDASGKSELSSLVAGLKPTGATPIALSLKVAGEELAKDKDAFCGIVLITDGLESCKGDPAAEAAALLAKLKLSFGVNVVGYGVKADEDAPLKAIADAGKGKYYSADDAAALADSISAIAKELKANAKPAEVVDVTRRALRILQPKIELPEMESISLVPEDEADSYAYTKVGSVTKYGEYLNVPSSSKKYAVVWQPKEGVRVFLKRSFSIPERRVVDIQPETILGMIQVNGTGKAKDIYVVKAGERGAVVTKIQTAKKYGDIMVVPAGKYDIYVDRSRIEEDLEVEAGKLQRL